ncbi:MAG: hypothetical protein ABL994_00050 [Verrucomicrobiales bacterium]
MKTALEKYLELPGIPAKGKNKLTGKVVEQHFREKDLWLYHPPLPTLAKIFKIENWADHLIAGLGIDLQHNYLIGDFGVGLSEGLVLDCSVAEPSIRKLQMKNQEEIEWECPIVFQCLSDFYEIVLMQVKITHYKK